MTTSIRYVQHTTTNNVNELPVGSSGKDSQLLAMDITYNHEITANSNFDILHWTGAGKLQSIISFQVESETGDLYVPHATNKTNVTIGEHRGFQSVNVDIPANGTAIAANSVFKLLLVVGNY